MTNQDIINNSFDHLIKICTNAKKTDYTNEKHRDVLVENLKTAGAILTDVAMDVGVELAEVAIIEVPEATDETTAATEENT